MPLKTKKPKNPVVHWSNKIYAFFNAQTREKKTLYSLPNTIKYFLIECGTFTFIR